jgi:FMN phosphatase YigB (HAD superfamily)
LIKTVLFDIGNVLAPDYWESLWLTRGAGLADQLGIPLSKAKDIGRKLYPHYSTARRNEQDYWDEFAAEIGRNIPMNLVREVEAAVIHPNPFADPAIEKAAAVGMRIGLVSSNTSFWYPKQLALLCARDKIDSALFFISCDVGVEKRRGCPDLFGIAAQAVDVKTTLIFDDRPHNVTFAAALGFRAELYGCREGGEVENGDYYQSSAYAPFPFEGTSHPKNGARVKGASPPQV